MKPAREKNGLAASSVVAEAAVGVMVVAGAAEAVAISGGRLEITSRQSADSCAGISSAQPVGHGKTYPAVSRVIDSKYGVRGNMSNS